jgi:hypothetical protein
MKNWQRLFQIADEIETVNGRSIRLDTKEHPFLTEIKIGLLVLEAVSLGAFDGIQFAGLRLSLKAADRQQGDLKAVKAYCATALAFLPPGAEKDVTVEPVDVFLMGGVPDEKKILLATTKPIAEQIRADAKQLRTATPPEGQQKDGGAGEPGSAKKKATGRKRSTVNGDAQTKLIAGLTKHHKYQDDCSLNQEPIGSNRLADLVGVSHGTASAFFKKKFKGYRKYSNTICRDTASLVASLKALNSEFIPADFLYGLTPPGEGGRDDDE